MTFDTFERSRAAGKPIKLYKFKYGSATPIAYTDGVASVTYNDGTDNLTYTPFAIKSPSVKTSGTLDKTEFRVTLAEGNLVAPQFILYPPAVPMTLTVYVGHAGDTDFKLGFSGTVLTVSRKGPECIVSCEPVTSALRRPGLLRNYQFACPYTLYEGRCGASKAAGTSSHTVQAVGSTSITLLSGWNGATALVEFRGGTIEWTNTDSNTEIRTILSPGATVLTVSGLIRDLSPSDSVDVIVGCDRSERACLDIHNVINDFGGQSNIPSENPFEINQFY